MNSTSFVIPPSERKVLETLKERTGVNKSTIVRRLLIHYAQGHPVSGLPTVSPPVPTPR